MMSYSTQPSKNWVNSLNQTDTYIKSGTNIALTSTIRYLPQTCIKYLTSNLWLTGSGPYLSIWKLTNNSTKPLLVAEVKVFLVERIKLVKIIKEYDNTFELVIIGGKSLKFIKLSLKEENNYKLTNLSEELKVRDWILDLYHVNNQNFNILLTHNIILKIQFNPDYSVVLSEELIYSPVNCLLYSGKLINEKLVIIGTIFNSVIIWNYENVNKENNKYYGSVECELKSHEGVIFNVNYTPDLSKLVSVSDDRSIRIWERNLENSNEYQYKLTHTIFGHTNRVWDAKFLPNNPLKLVSISEDSTLKYWELEDNEKFNKVQSWRVCEGKNCWSLDINQLGDQVLVGSNDSSLKLFNLKNLKKIENTTELCFNFELPNLSDYHSNVALPTKNEVNNEEDIVVKSKPKRDFIRNFSPLGVFESIGISDLGYIFKFNLTKENGNDWKTSQPKLIALYPELEHYCMVGSLDYDQLQTSTPLVVLGTLSGQIILLMKDAQIENKFNIKKLDVSDNKKVVSLKLTKYGKDDYLLLVYCINNYSKLYYINNQLDIKLVEELKVESLHPMTIHYNSELRHLAVGSRQGNLLIFELSESLDFANLLLIHKNLHKSESLTSLRFTNSQNLLTCGRDGAYQLLNPLNNYSIKLYSKLTKGWIENVQIINNEPLITYFFQKRLIVFNLTKNEELFSIQCGGGHREWYLMPMDCNLVNGSVVYLRKEKIVIYPIGNGNSIDEEDEGEQSLSNEFNLVLKSGLHGKEIRTLSHIKTSTNSELLITGAEAGNLKLIEKTSDNTLNFKLNLKAHTSVITQLTHLQLNNRDYLISAGGCEELKIWSLNPDEFSIKEVFNNPVYSIDLEVRIMGLHYIAEMNLLVVGYSDGKLRIFELVVEDGDKLRLELAKSTEFLNSCILSITSSYLNPSTVILACGTVSGQIGLFNLQTLLNSKKSDEPFLIDKVHQNGVNCLISQLVNSREIWFVSGGEDNSLSIIKIISSGEESDDNFNCKIKNITNTYNDSAIQGLQFYDTLKFCSISLDQRLNGWEIDNSNGEEGANLVLEFQKFSNISDPSDLQFWTSESSNDENTIEFGIVGIGLEIIKLN